MPPKNIDFPQLVRDWIAEVGNDRSTMVAGLAALDTLSEKCPLSEDDVFSKEGSGEIRKARGSSMRALLAKYDLPKNYLADGATTRGAAGKTRLLLNKIDFGRPLVKYSVEQRTAVVRAMIEVVVEEIRAFFRKQRIKVPLDRQGSPINWVETILTSARSKSAGRVEQHLVGAKLQTRHRAIEVSSYSGNAADVQTERAGDFVVGAAIYHVTTAPGLALIRKCKDNLLAGSLPVLIVPRDKIGVANSHAEAEGIQGRIQVTGIEDFLAANIVEMSNDAQAQFIDTLREVLQEYNRRIETSETDQSLKIEIP
ncbi:MAG: DUF4928 family protein [Chloroflexi bacterium]|nr:DUF4928 family protein [Chloroflexota bacterium]